MTADGKLFIGGQAADIHVADSSGVTRVEMGALQANGVSPAQEGIRVNDASGNPIFDSLGLIGVGSMLANDQGTPNAAVANNGSANGVTIPGSGTAFAVARACNVLVWGGGAAAVSPAGSYTGTDVSVWSGGVGGTLVGKVSVGLSNSNDYTTYFGQMFVHLPAAGTYQVSQQSKNGSGFTTTYIYSSAQVMLLGG